MKVPINQRREFLKFMGRSGLALSLGTPFVFSACKFSDGKNKTGNTLDFKPLSPSLKDDVILAEGFSYKLLIQEGQKFSPEADLLFGANNDYLALIPVKGNPQQAILWVNHESLTPLLLNGYTKGPKTHAQVMLEQKAVGGSLILIQKESNGDWSFVEGSAYNRRVDGRTMIPFVSERAIEGKTSALGTLANCAGGVTPWHTVLTCEENYDQFYGESIYSGPGKKTFRPGREEFSWWKFDQQPPEHYGWVVEVDPINGKAKKLTSLGRFSHECATVVQGNDGRCVVYSGDDANDQCLYKFIADKPGQLETGELFVADFKNYSWISLDIDKHEVLKKNFTDQTDVLIRCRQAAHLLGGTPLNRPEDIEVDPQTKAIFITQTNNKSRGDYHGAITKLVENDNDPFSLGFSHETFLTGGEKNGFSCPDNLVFDKNGDLWMTSDISGSQINKPPYNAFGNNGLFYIPMSGPDAGQVYQVAAAPVDAEFTGPCFSADGETLFLSVQHPGENSPSLSQLTSHWPGSKGSIPRSTVIQIKGPALQR